MSTTIENFLLRFKTEGTQGIKSAQKDMGSLKGVVKDLKGELDGAVQSIGGASGSLASMGARLGPVGATIGAVTAVTIGLGMAAVKAADQLQDLATATGTSASQLMNLQASMILAGGNADSYEKAIARLNLQIGEAASGNKNAMQTFKDLGVAVRDSYGEIRPTSEVLQDVVKKLSLVTDKATATRIAVSLMGKEMSRLDPSQLDASSNAITDAEVAKLAEFQNRIDQLKISLSQTNTKFFGSLLMQLDEVMAKSAQAQQDWPKLMLLLKHTGRAFGPVGMATATGIEQVVGAPKPKAKVKTVGVLKNPTQYKPGRAAPLEVLAPPKVNPNNTALDYTGTGSGIKQPKPAKTGSASSGPSQAQQQAQRAQEDLAQSQKRITQATARYEIEMARSTGNEIEAIRLQMNADIAEATAEIRDKSLLSETQKVEEIAAVTKNIRLKAEQDILQTQKDQRRELDSILQQQRDLSASIAERKADEAATLFMSTRQREAYYEQKELTRLNNLALEEQKKLKGEVADITPKATPNEQAFLSVMQAQTAELEKQLALKGMMPVKPATPDGANLSALLGDMSGSTAEGTNKVISKAVETINKGSISDALKAQFDTMKEGVGSVVSVMKDFADPVSVVADQTASLFNNMNNAIDEFVRTGKFKFADFAKSVIRDLIAIQMKAAAVELLNTVLESAFGITPTGKAVGGNINSNTPYIVGERGPELFMPSSTGKIINNNSLGSMNTASGSTNQPTAQTNVTYNIQAVDALSFRQMVARDPEFIYSVTEQGKRRQPR